MLSFFLLRYKKTLTDIHLKGITLTNNNKEVRGWPRLFEVVQAAFRAVSLEIENCGVLDSGSLLGLEDKHHNYNKKRQVLKVADSKGLDNIIRLLRRRA